MLRIILLLLILMNIDLSAKEWVKKHYIVQEYINTFQCVDSSNCYAFANEVTGRANRIYKSTDQGNLWEVIYEDYYDSLEEINKCFVLDTSNIFMTYGGDFFIDKSTDGGQTFRRTIFEYPGREFKGYVTDIQMYNKDIGLVISTNDLFYTKDGWDTYKALILGNYQYAGAPIFFIDSNNVGISAYSSNSSTFHKFNLDDESWSSYYVPNPLPEGEKDRTISRISFVNDSVWYACGYQDNKADNYVKDLIWKTVDKGKQWDLIFENSPEESYPISAISFRDEKHGMAAGSWGKVLETEDGGKTWDYIEVPIVEGDGYELFTIMVRAVLAGQYNIVSSLRGGIYRYEDPVSVQESEFKDATFKINQTPENLTINISDENHRKYRLQIVDMQGKIMYEGSLLYILENVVSLSGFSSGVYVYRITCEGTLARSGKFAVTK
ncbi:MAG: T9SS type A sorting domain-containing protein [Chlorobi bacterium]|nr:T9SS type A sorting domain-containing protein [Chlorobiota bacterium]